MMVRSLLEVELVFQSSDFVMYRVREIKASI